MIFARPDADDRIIAITRNSDSTVGAEDQDDADAPADDQPASEQ